MTATRTRPLSRLYGPCNHGPGPCGNPDSQPYHCGPRCSDHPPLGIDWLKPRTEVTE